MPDVEFRFVGLVRNPMDTLYSVWQRWRGLPEEYQFHWLTAYRNLLRFKELVGERLIMVRYESLVTGAARVGDLLEGLGIRSRSELLDHSLHTHSLLKWQHDASFGFRLDARVAALAREFGYSDQQLASTAHSQSKLYWWRHRVVHRALVSPQHRVREHLRNFGASLVSGPNN